MKTEAAILVEPGTPLVIDEIQVPDLIPGQVLVEITFSGACHTQILEARGYRGRDPWCPHCLGHEAVGIVLQISEGVSKVAEGDEVVLTWLKGIGADVGGTQYTWGGQQVNAGAVTTFSRKTVVSENRLVRKPDHLNSKLAVLLGCAAPTGFGALINVCAAKKEHSLIVFGAGGVGLCAIAAASFIGCNPIVAVDVLPTKLDLALQFGATQIINSETQNLANELTKIIPQGVDFAIEAVGETRVMSQALESVRPQGGKAVVIGNARDGQLVSMDPKLFNQGKSLMGCWGGNSHPDRDIEDYTQIISANRDIFNALFSTPYKLADINVALDDLESGEIGRPIIDMAM